MNNKSIIILSIDQSTSRCSAAITANNTVIAQDHWDSKLIHNQNLFKHLMHLLKNAQVSPETIDMYSVGTGPGSFAGIRTSISALSAMALPARKPVIGIDIGQAITTDVISNSKTNILTIAGDARRNRLWYATFKRNNDSAEMITDYTLTTHEEFPLIIDTTTTISSPDWDRLKTYLTQSIQPRFELISSQATPRATTIAAIALKKYKKAIESTGQITTDTFPAPLPIYMHPAVAPMTTP